MKKKSSKAKPKRLPGAGSNRMLGCGALVIATPNTTKYQLDGLEPYADIMAKWNGQRFEILKNRLGPVIAGEAKTIEVALKLILKAGDFQQPASRDLPGVLAAEDCKNAAAKAFYHFQMGNKSAARFYVKELRERMRLLEDSIGSSSD